MWLFQARFKRQMRMTDLPLAFNLCNGPKKEPFQGRMKEGSVTSFQGMYSPLLFLVSVEKNYAVRQLMYVNRPDSLEFGAGSHACPGRFFATNALMVALIRILDRYDFRLRVRNGHPRSITTCSR
jgi:Cytochrome P450